MKNFPLLVILFLFCFQLEAQESWQWTQISSLPIATTGNAVCEATPQGQKHVYSFGGISDSLTPSDVHKRVFKYKVSDNLWTEIANIPDSMGRLLSKASFVNNRVYLIGGKYILEDSTELVSGNVNILNPSLDTFEVNGSALPTPVYGHVQSVWRDSLIYVISGNNGTENTPVVQIYNPYFNSWIYGDPIPDNDGFKSKGASGYIIGDTIFYYGGAIESPHPQPVNALRKGVINPDNPLQINWSVNPSYPQSTYYSGVASGHNNTVFWVGGSKDYYNFNLTKHDTTSTATSINQIIEFSTPPFMTFKYQSTPYSVVDLNGIAKLGGGNWIIAGGVDSLNQVTDRVFLLHNSSLSDIAKAQQPPIFQVNETNNYYIAVTENIGDIIIYSITGKTTFKAKKHLSDLYIPKSSLTSGILMFVYEDNFNLPVVIKKINP